MNKSDWTVSSNTEKTRHNAPSIDYSFFIFIKFEAKTYTCAHYNQDIIKIVRYSQHWVCQMMMMMPYIWHMKLCNNATDYSFCSEKFCETSRPVNEAIDCIVSQVDVPWCYVLAWRYEHCIGKPTCTSVCFGEKAAQVWSESCRRKISLWKVNCFSYFTDIYICDVKIACLTIVWQ